MSDSLPRTVRTDYDKKSDVMYISFYDPPLAADDSVVLGDVIIRIKDFNVIGITFFNWKNHLSEEKEL